MVTLRYLFIQPKDSKIQIGSYLLIYSTYSTNQSNLFLDGQVHGGGGGRMREGPEGIIK